jgi:insertion element IS1 protein InsB
VALCPKKSQKLWIWKALDSDTGQLLDWECGRRDQHTFKKLYKRLQKYQVRLYCTDEYHVYSAIIPAKRLAMSKRVTKGIERNHTPNRHWFARFKRKSIVVSRSIEMVDLTMALFAKFHVNGDDRVLLEALII